ncbi:MAG: hypothetical protein ACRDBG_07885 [Waterburya sp.]
MSCDDLATKKDVEAIRRQIDFLEDLVLKGFSSIEKNQQEWKGKQQKYNDAVAEILKVAREWKGKQQKYNEALYELLVVAREWKGTQQKYNEAIYEIREILRKMKEPNFWATLLKSALILAAIAALLKGISIRPEFKFIIDKLIGELNINVNIDKIFDKLVGKIDVKLAVKFNLIIQALTNLNIKANAILAAIGLINTDIDLTGVIELINNLSLEIDGISDIVNDIKIDVETIETNTTDINVDVDLSGIEADIDTLINAVNSINVDIDLSTIESDISTIQLDISTIKSEIETLDLDVDIDLSTIESDISTIQLDISTIRSEIETLDLDVDVDVDLSSVETAITTLTGTFENNLMIINTSIEQVEEKLVIEAALEDFECEDSDELVLAGSNSIIVRSLNDAIITLNNQIVEVQKQVCELDSCPITILAEPKELLGSKGKILVLDFVDLELFNNRKRNDLKWRIQIPNAKEDYDWCRDFDAIRWERGKSFHRLKLKEYRQPVSGWFNGKDASNSFFDQILPLTLSEEENRYYPERKTYKINPDVRITRVHRAYLVDVDPETETNNTIKCYRPEECNG